MRVKLLSLTLTALAAGCGDPLLTGTAYDTPLLSFQPSFDEPNDVTALSGMSIGIVWVDPLQLRDDLPQPPEGISVGGPTAGRVFTVGLYGPPPEAAIRRIPDESGTEVAVSFAFGEIVLFADGDGDGRFAISPRVTGSQMFEPDAYTGSSDRHVVIYVEQPARGTAFGSAVWRTLTEGPGYRLASVANCASPPATLNPVLGDKAFAMTLAREPSRSLIVTRPCLSPTRAAIGPQP